MAELSRNHSKSRPRRVGRLIYLLSSSCLLPLYIFTFLLQRLPQAAAATSNASSSNTAASNPSTFVRPVIQISQQLNQDIQCYSLPYGLLGMLSHIWTFYCVIVNALGNKPSQPWKQRQQSIPNIILGTVQMISTTVLAVANIRRCHGSTNIVLLATSMLLISATSSLAAKFGNGWWLVKHLPKPQDSLLSNLRSVGPTSMLSPGTSVPVQQYATSWCDDDVKRCSIKQPIHCLHKNEFDLVGPSVPLLGATWATGALLGLFAGLNIAIPLFQSHKSMLWLTFGFLGPPTLIASFWNPYFLYHRNGQAWVIGVNALLVLLYTDWVLAAASGNWLGSPTDADMCGKTIYWTYFVVKRLSFLCL